MASNYPRPIYELTDNTPRVPFVPADKENLFAPFIPFFAEKGPVGKIMYSGDVSFGDTFGTAMVDINSKFHTLSNGFVNAGLNGPTPVNIYGVRLCDPAALAASAVITLTPTPMKIPQYQTDALGNRMLDSNNHPIPLMGSDGKTQVVEPGIVLVWGLRPLDSGETVDTAKTTKVTSGSQTLQCYPICAAQGSSVGSALNNNGLKLYRPSSPSTDIESRIGSVLYRFAPYHLDPTLDTTASAVMNSSGMSYTDVSFKPNAVDPLTATAYNFTKLIYSKYYDGNSLPLLDMNIAVYSANLKTVGDMCLAASPELAESVTDSWSLDLMTAIDAAGIPYRHIAIDPSSAKVISATVINYLSGGTDGDTSEAMFQSQLAAYINNAAANGFKNIGRYQFTHMFDPGWPIALKKQFISLLGQRQLLKLVISTQDASLPPNTMDQDISTAEALAAVLALYPESMATANISAVRADICYHSAKLASQDLSTDPVPMITYKRFYQLAQYHGGQYITGSPCGEPGSFITEFRPNTVNWVPDDEDQMDAAYAKKAIYAQYASRNQLFIPFLRSAGAVDSSVLSGSNFVDLLLYKMKLCFGVWAKASGSDTPHKELFPTIQKDITTRFRQAFGSSNTDTIVLQQTVGDANDGDKVHAYITNYSDPDLRDITFSFILERGSDTSSTSTTTGS